MLAEDIHHRRSVDMVWYMLAAYFQQDIDTVGKSLDISPVETVADLRLLRNVGRISYHLVQRASVKTGWRNQSCLAADTVVQQLAACTVGTQSLDDAAVVDSWLDDVAVEDDLVWQQYLQCADY